MYRVQQLGKDTLAMHWQRHKVGAAHWREMAERGETDARGASPSAPIPRACIRRPRRCRRRSTNSSSPASCAKPVSSPKALTCDLDVPADADFVTRGIHRSCGVRS
jgi:4-hydroxy-3-polyprenylbenzoate decarboxylase